MENTLCCQGMAWGEDWLQRGSREFGGTMPLFCFDYGGGSTTLLVNNVQNCQPERVSFMVCNNNSTFPSRWSEMQRPCPRLTESKPAFYQSALTTTPPPRPSPHLCPRSPRPSPRPVTPAQVQAVEVLVWRTQRKQNFLTQEGSWWGFGGKNCCSDNVINKNSLKMN